MAPLDRRCSTTMLKTQAPQKQQVHQQVKEVFCATAVEPLSTPSHPCAWGHARNSTLHAWNNCVPHATCDVIMIDSDVSWRLSGKLHSEKTYTSNNEGSKCDCKGVENVIGVDGIWCDLTSLHSHQVISLEKHRKIKVSQAPRSNAIDPKSKMSNLYLRKNVITNVLGWG